MAADKSPAAAQAQPTVLPIVLQPPVRKASKAGLALFSLAASIFGMLAVIAAFFAADYALSVAQQTMQEQIEGAIAAAGDVQQGASYSADALDAAAPSLANISSSMRGYADFTSSTADSMQSISSSLDMLALIMPNASAPSSLSASATQLRETSGGFLAAAQGLDSAGSSISSASSSVRLLASDMGAIKENLNSTKEGAEGAIGALRIALLLFTFALLLLLSSVAASSISSML